MEGGECDSCLYGVRDAMIVAATPKETSVDVAIDWRRHWPSESVNLVQPRREPAAAMASFFAAPLPRRQPSGLQPPTSKDGDTEVPLCVAL